MHIFSGIHKNRVLESPKRDITRPTSGRLRETLFNICQQYVAECRFLDLFAGSGAMGLEALSRGAIKSTFVDSSKESIRCIKTNVNTLKEEGHTKIIYGDVFEQLIKLAKEGCQYDIIYADPPYENIIHTPQEALFLSARLLKIIDEQLENQIQLLVPGGMFFIEEAANVSLENIPLLHLKLKNSRSTGKAALHYYTY
ncbi:MAG: 16S rRNA (guanine(966)-N(2))-methyltransferase RsmD [Parachlamydiaceae bacterium]|nr:16S rRNA (guanine(966)-N(2))-methyltransferase RsmD [Parachlamydiaceae bacterium]